MHKKDLGSLGEHIVITECLQHGVSVFKDVGDNSRFDLVIDNNGTLLKVQVKAVTRRNDCTPLLLYKSGPNGYNYVYSQNDVDWFAIVDVETWKVAWLKYSEFEGFSAEINLRHGPTRNNQTKNVRFFVDYTKFPFGNGEGRGI